MDYEARKARLREIADELGRLERERDEQATAYDKRIGKLREEQRDLNEQRTRDALGRTMKTQLDASALRAWSNVRLT